ncbi:MAG: hypothetical protein PHY80_01260 [Rickettsiales bacterium]|nr:hypothetical protein [Rickettsiales bacterium]
MDKIGQTSTNTKIGGDLNATLKTGALNSIEGIGGKFMTESINDKVGEVIKTKVVSGEFSDSMKALTAIQTELSTEGNSSLGVDPRSLMRIDNFTVFKSK